MSFIPVTDGPCGSCFTGNSVVGGVLVKDILPGDVLGGATVKYIARYEVPHGAHICSIAGMGLTPFHPIRVDGEWMFPYELVEPRFDEHVNMLYNIVLDSKHLLASNGKQIEAITLGHGFTDPHVAHPYFGTEACVRDIEKYANKEGIATFSKYEWIRDWRGRVVDMRVHTT